MVILQVLPTSNAHPYVEIEPRAFVGDERNWRINIPPEAELKSTTKNSESENKAESNTEASVEGSEKLSGADNNDGDIKNVGNMQFRGRHRGIGARKQGEDMQGSIGQTLFDYGAKFTSHLKTNLYGYGQGLLNRLDSAMRHAAQQAKHVIPNLLVHSFKMWNNNHNNQLALPLKKMYAELSAA